jgi:hypothetical protein
MTEDEIIEKYRDKVYTKERTYNIVTIRSIVNLFLNDGYPNRIWKSSDGALVINDEAYYGYGGTPVELIASLIELCKNLREDNFINPEFQKI